MHGVGGDWGNFGGKNGGVCTGMGKVKLRVKMIYLNTNKSNTITTF